MGSANQGDTMANALILIHWSLIPRGHLPLPVLTEMLVPHSAPPQSNFYSSEGIFKSLRGDLA